MTERVPADQIEQIVGAKRHAHQHLGRADSSTRKVSILHPSWCKESTPDLRDCAWSLALDRGIDPDWWEGYEDRPVVLTFWRAQLIPAVPGWLADQIEEREATSTPVGPSPAPEWVTEIVPALLRRRKDLRAAGLEPVGAVVPERLRDDEEPLAIICGLPVTWSTGETFGLIVGVS